MLPVSYYYLLVNLRERRKKEISSEKGGEGFLISILGRRRVGRADLRNCKGIGKLRASVFRVELRELS